MVSIKEIIYYYSGFRGEANPVVIVYEDQQDENGLYPIVELRGEVMTVSHFQGAVVNQYAMRKELNNWLDEQLTKKNKNVTKIKN